MTAIAFRVGCDYTRDEIHDRVGGSKRACLPTRDGAVVAACLLRSFNPRAPHEVQCGQGVRNAPMGALLARQRTPIPVFVKFAVNRWRYEGRSAVADSFESGVKFRACIAGSGRAVASVSRIVLLTPA